MTDNDIGTIRGVAGATGELDFIVVEAQPLPVGSDQPGNPDHVDQAGAQQGVDPQILSKKAAKKKQNLEKRAKKKGGGNSNEYPVWRVLRVLKVVECKNSSIDMWYAVKFSLLHARNPRMSVYSP